MPIKRNPAARPLLPPVDKLSFDELIATQAGIVEWGRKHRETADLAELESALADIAKLTAEYNQRMADAEHEVAVRSMFADPPRPQKAPKPVAKYVIHLTCGRHEQLSEPLAIAHAAGEAAELPCVYCMKEGDEVRLTFPAAEFSKLSAKRPFDPKGPKGWIVEVEEEELHPDGSPILDDHGVPRKRKRWVNKGRTVAAAKRASSAKVR